MRYPAKAGITACSGVAPLQQELEMRPLDYFEKHSARFASAKQACRTRQHWSAFPDMPSAYPGWEAAQTAAVAQLAAMRDQRFELDQAGIMGELGQEVSPYTQKPLQIRYPLSKLDALFDAAQHALPAWQRAPLEERLGVLLEALDCIYREHLFLIRESVMHTAGQSGNMAYAGSGVNALDRGLEALVYAEMALQQVTPTARWERDFGATRISLNKSYRIIPRGVAVCFTCATFATWNAWPSMLASLATGNAVIVKPHPGSILPMAITVRVFREVLAQAGFDPHLVSLAVDSTEQPIGQEIALHPAAGIVDFTGSARFGAWIERNVHHAMVYTETSGCNTVILESVEDLDAVLRSLATTLSMFSAQMCTSPQNIYVPKSGVQTPQGRVNAEEVGARLAQCLNAIGQDPKKASMILSCIQSETSLRLMDEMRALAPRAGRLMLEPGRYAHPQFANARTATPMLIQTTTQHGDLYREERFGPISFLIECQDADDCLHQATSDVKRHGGLTAFLYSQNEDYIDRAETAYAHAGAQLTINLTGPMPLNFAAAYSDYHVTGLNPAGNATLTDLSFIAGRFRIAQSRRPAPPVLSP
jgi:phenylacetic acid degradation protein paaN